VTSIHRTPAERQGLLDRYRRSADPQVRLRAHILLLLGAGHPRATRNHRCHTMDELLDLTFDWFETRTHFRIETSVYGKTP
jgi:hypothetical protein